MIEPKVLIQKSEIDRSVNFIINLDNSFIECRYVRRTDKQVIVYLSSFNGCNLSCRFCHLTATGQTGNIPVSRDLYEFQLYKVLDYWWNNDRTGDEETINLNFMARGEPLNNPEFKYDYYELNKALVDICQTYGFTDINFNISSIIPNDINVQNLYSLIDDNTKLYWSLYSPSTKFRKKWLPKSMAVDSSAQIINNYREYGGQVVLHSAFIKGQNDSEDDIKELIGFIKYHGLDDLNFNIIAYNPYDSRYGEETDRKSEIYQALSEAMNGRVQIIGRIGFDVKASCGCFFDY